MEIVAPPTTACSFHRSIVIWDADNDESPMATKPSISEMLTYAGLERNVLESAFFFMIGAFSGLYGLLLAH